MTIDNRLIEPDNTYHPPTEREEWDAHGCSNRQEYREYLNQQMWKEWTCDIKNGCYIGTHESNLQKFRRYRNTNQD